MTAIRTLFVLLLAGAILAGAPSMVIAGAMASAECPMLDGAPSDDSCCGNEAGMPGCDVVCAMGVAVVIGEVNQTGVARLAGAPLEGPPLERCGLSRPPDTAPPKSVSA